MSDPKLAKPPARRLTSARLPTETAEFRLMLYRRHETGRDHLALVLGELEGVENVLVRIHSECFTGDVLGSTRCDCGEQLALAMHMVAEEGRGAVLYLRQEGRGIGLLQKLRAYNLQDAGYDTVEANLELGHQADERDYGVAVDILRDLGIASVRLLTNNPTKVEGLANHGYEAVKRVPLEIPAKPENASYLQTKVRRMRHLLDLDAFLPDARAVASRKDAPGEPALVGVRGAGARPSVTLAYAQTLDGSIAARRGRPMLLSGDEALELTHRLRARHDAILVGVGTVIADDPRLTVRLVEGENPQPIVLDGNLRTPVEAHLLTDAARPPWIITTSTAPENRRRDLESAGAVVLSLPATEDGRVAIDGLLSMLKERGIGSLMVEGGARVLTAFLRAACVDRMVVTVAPILVGGLSAIGSLGPLPADAYPRLVRTRQRWLGECLVLVGEVESQMDRSQEDAEDVEVGLGGAF